MPDSNVGFTAGTGTTTDTWQMPSGDHRQVMVKDVRGIEEYRATSFRIPGNAVAGGMRLGGLFNATANTVVVVNFVAIDLYQTATKLVTVEPWLFRVRRMFGAGATGGAVLTKVAMGDTTTASDASVTARGGSSADGTGVALSGDNTGGIITQEFLGRMFTAVNYEMADRVELINNSRIVLGYNQGLMLHVDTAGAAVPATDSFVFTINWTEYPA